MRETHDILIVGGGPVGATLALALQGYGLAVTLLEARARGAGEGDPRALALSQGSRLILQRIGVWDEVAAHATAIETIHVSQRGSLGRTVLHAAEHGQEALGYVLPYAALSTALEGKLARTPEVSVEYGARGASLQPLANHAEVKVEQGGEEYVLHAQLAVLADGGRSLGELPGMRREVREYGQHALVAQVEAELPHNNVAYERFTSAGPVALLPQGKRGFALVWTASPEDAAALSILPEAEFLQRLHHHFGDRLGRFLQVSARATFPLKLSTLRPVVGEHLAVIGNAAQTLHPVAGQGFNLGLRDAWELAHIVRETPLAEIGGAPMLAQYQSRRQFDTGGGIFFTDFLVRVFSNSLPGLAPLRGTGLALTELLAPAKQFVAGKMSFGARG